MKISVISSEKYHEYLRKELGGLNGDGMSVMLQTKCVADLLKYFFQIGFKYGYFFRKEKEHEN